MKKTVGKYIVKIFRHEQSGSEKAVGNYVNSLDMDGQIVKILLVITL